MNRIRPAAVAGSWYPGSAPELAAAVDRHLARAAGVDVTLGGELVALIAPHAGLMYSGPVAAHASVVRGRRALLVASTDLSHYHDRTAAARLDATFIECVSRFDADALQDALNLQPEHACGGGPTVAVMHAAELLGARDAVVLNYADSGEVSGDTSAVVGYLAAAFGTFDNDRREH